MTAGVLKNLRRLDHMLSPFLKSPSRLAPGLLSLLRLAAYELLACEKPGRITNEYVQLARQLSYARAGGLVNGAMHDSPDDCTLALHAVAALILHVCHLTSVS